MSNVGIFNLFVVDWIRISNFLSLNSNSAARLLAMQGMCLLWN